MDRDFCSNLSFPCPKDAPLKLWATFAQRLQRWSFEILNIYPYKCIGPIQMHMESNLTSRLKGKTSMYDHRFSNFGRPPVPDDLCLASAPRHPGEEDFLSVLYRHGGHLSQRITTFLALFRSPNLRRLYMKFEQNWLSGFRGEVVWKMLTNGRTTDKKWSL